MHKQVIGWDVGGAHLKAVLLQKDGRPQQAIQVPCALWRGLNELEVAIAAVMEALNSAAFLAEETLHAITMTGELVDLFENRQQGVAAISEMMNAQLPGKKLFYAGRLNDAPTSHFVRADAVAQHWQTIASANWLASASYMGHQLKQQANLSGATALLIDIGSTTTDFIVIQDGQPQCLAFTDAVRMQAEELVYTGVVRTPLMAITQKVLFKNKVTSLAAEYFATMADVYRLTGDLPEDYDMADTADGKEKTPVASARRLARMIGHDIEDCSFEDWKALANEFKRIQLARLVEVARQHTVRINAPADTTTIIGAGAGSFLVKAIAAELNATYLENTFLLNDLRANTVNQSNDVQHWANICLPAYAVAYLALNIGVN